MAKSGAPSVAEDFLDFETEDQSYMIPDALPGASARRATDAGTNEDADEGFDAAGRSHDDADAGFDVPDDIHEGQGEYEPSTDESIYPESEYPGADDSYDTDADAPVTSSKSGKPTLAEWIRKPANLVTVLAGCGLAGFMAFQVMGSYQRMTAQPAPAQTMAFTPTAPAQPSQSLQQAEPAHAGAPDAAGYIPSYDAQAVEAAAPATQPPAEAPATAAITEATEATGTTLMAPGLKSLPANIAEPAPVHALSESPSSQAAPAQAGATASPDDMAVLRLQLAEQADRMNALERSNEAAVAALTALKKELGALTKRTAAVAPQAVAPRPAARPVLPTYEFVGGVEDAVWIRSSAGELVKIRVGDRLSGYGEVTSVDKRGAITTQSGPVKLTKPSAS